MQPTLCSNSIPACGARSRPAQYVLPFVSNQWYYGGINLTDAPLEQQYYASSYSQCFARSAADCTTWVSTGTTPSVALTCLSPKPQIIGLLVRKMLRDHCVIRVCLEHYNGFPICIGNSQRKKISPLWLLYCTQCEPCSPSVLVSESVRTHPSWCTGIDR
jgi:hypothetical protein